MIQHEDCWRAYLAALCPWAVGSVADVKQEFMVIGVRRVATLQWLHRCRVCKFAPATDGNEKCKVVNVDYIRTAIGVARGAGQASERPHT